MPYFSQVAVNTPFDNSSNGFVADNTQTAIEEVKSLVTESSKAFTFAFYNGNANAQRWLEFFPGIASDEAPIRVIGALSVRAIVARTVSTNATCTIGFYNVTTSTLLYTITFSAVKEVVMSAAAPGLFTLPAGGSLGIKVDTGSISKPHIYFTGQGG